MVKINKNQLFFNNTNFNLIIKKSKIENAGIGLFLHEKSQPILKGTLVGYYYGYWNFDKNKQTNCSYYINDKISIDVDLNNRPYTSFMNDAYRTEFSNNIISNCILEEHIIQKLSKKNCHNYDPNKIIELFSVKDIMPGEELFFEYGESYWKSW